MALFSTPEEKEAKKEAKIDAVMERYGLQNLSPEYRDRVRTIYLELMGSGILDLSTKLNFSTKSEDLLKISYLNALVQQNWMIISLLDEIKRK